MRCFDRGLCVRGLMSQSQNELTELLLESRYLIPTDLCCVSCAISLETHAKALWESTKLIMSCDDGLDNRLQSCEGEFEILERKPEVVAGFMDPSAVDDPGNGLADATLQKCKSPGRRRLGAPDARTQQASTGASLSRVAAAR